uniref:Uncharacterized protein n=1 Tax=Tanacetum cinerariifolium TaxID=118510 RepID=A0A699HT14_TANCI|nr:hypothetical protein [Tanacetum cinerariifolium]
MNDSMIELHETFQAWLQKEQVVNLDSYTPKPSQCKKIPIYYDDDDYEESSTPLRYIITSELPLCIAITPVLSTEEPVDSLIMEDEHLDTILATESDEVIKSSVEDLVLIPSESEGIPDNMCDVPFRDNSPPLDISKDQFEDFFNSNDDSTSIEDDYFSIDDINYVEASPPDYELVSLEEETDTSDNSLPESKIFYFNMEEKRSGNPTSHTDLSLPDYEAFYCDSEPDLGNFTINVVEDIFDNPTRKPRVHVPNILPTHPTLYLDSNFTPSDDSLGSDLIVSFPFGTRNRIFDPGIFREVQSKRFLSPNEFSISFIRDPLSLLFDTLLLFSSKNEEKDFNPGSLSLYEATSPLFAYVVWIFLLFLTYLVAPPYLLSSRNKDTIFDPGISIYHSFIPGVSHRSGTFVKFNIYPNHLNESPMEILSSTCFPMD